MWSQAPAQRVKPGIRRRGVAWPAEPMDDLRQSLQPLYLDAVYEVDVPGGRIAFRIGEAIPRLAGQAFALITAYNPGACRPSPAENERRNAALERRVAEAGHKVLPGRGRDVSGDHVEPSFAAFGVTLGAALAVAREFGQAAIAWFDGTVVKLEWAGEAGGGAAP